MATTEITARHTPGPWQVKPAFGGTGFNIMSAPIGGRTFRLFESDHGTADDAQVAAAAPLLLSALKECALEIAQIRNRSLTAGEQIALDNAREIIALAEQVPA